jgi:zinc transport system substrate-binding protein
MKAWVKRTFLLSVGLVLALAGCSNADKPNEGSDKAQLNVVTTFYPMYEFSRQVAGEYANVVALVPTGVEPHDWEPSAQDMAKIKEADIFVYNGGVEGWVDDALSSASNDKRIVVEASHGIELMEGVDDGHNHGHEHEGETGHEHEEDHEGEAGHEGEADHGHEEGHSHVLDPHVWLDPVLAQQQIATIQAAFEQADPQNAANYKKNAEAYIAKLQELDESFRSTLKDAKRKEFVTQHAAFGYLAKRYGLTQVPIAGLSPDQEPAPDRMVEIIDFAKEHQVKTIFFETLVQPKVAQTIANEIGAQTDVLNPLEGLTEEDQKQNLDYIGAMEKNLEALKKALNE